MLASYATRTILAVALFCGAAAHAAPPAEPKIFGQLHEIMMMGKSDPHVKLSELPRKNAFAVGALSGLRGEVTMLDGAIWLSHGSGDGSIRVESPRTSDETATLLVYAQVQKWQGVKIARGVPFAELDATVERLAKEKGIDVSKPFPVRIEGELTGLRWHALKGAAPQPGSHDPGSRGPGSHGPGSHGPGSHGPGGHGPGSHGSGSHGPGGHAHHDHDQLVVTQTNAKAKGQLVGFFSTGHHGVFTHMGENTHFHVILPAEKQMGHVEAVTLAAGAKLLLPK